MPMVTDHAMLQTVSQNVGMKRSAISVATGRLVRSDVPKSQRTTPLEEADELLGQRAIESEVLADQLDGLGRGVGTRGETRRIAGQQVDEHENQQRRRSAASEARPSRRLAMY